MNKTRNLLRCLIPRRLRRLAPFFLRAWQPAAARPAGKTLVNRDVHAGTMHVGLRGCQARRKNSCEPPKVVRSPEELPKLFLKHPQLGYTESNGSTWYGLQTRHRVFKVYVI